MLPQEKSIRHHGKQTSTQPGGPEVQKSEQDELAKPPWAQNGAKGEFQPPPILLTTPKKATKLCKKKKGGDVLGWTGSRCEEIWDGEEMEKTGAAMRMSLGKKRRGWRTSAEVLNRGRVNSCWIGGTANRKKKRALGVEGCVVPRGGRETA